MAHLAQFQWNMHISCPLREYFNNIGHHIIGYVQKLTNSSKSFYKKS